LKRLKPVRWLWQEEEIAQQFRIQTVNYPQTKKKVSFPVRQVKIKTKWRREKLFAVPSTFKTFQIICYELHITIEFSGWEKSCVKRTQKKVLMAQFSVNLFSELNVFASSKSNSSRQNSSPLNAETTDSEEREHEAFEVTINNETLAQYIRVFR
jgi:hypothetical protein